MIDWKERYDRLLRLSIISVVIIIIELIKGNMVSCDYLETMEE